SDRLPAAARRGDDSRRAEFRRPRRTHLGAAAMTGLRWMKIAAPLSLFVLWQVAVSTRFLNPGLFPPPSAIFANFIDYARSGELGTNAYWTLSRLLIGLVIGGIPGTLVGPAMGGNGG